MVRPDRGSLARTAPLQDLLGVLLRQFRRPLAAYNVQLSDAEAEHLAGAIVHGAPPDEKAEEVRGGLVQVVEESEAVLREWGLTFEQSMETDMAHMPGWETTAEFLEIANEKSNAELRIAAGASLLAALGQTHYLPYLLYLAGREDDDVDRIVARRVLEFRSGIVSTAPDWLERVTRWAGSQASGG